MIAGKKSPKRNNDKEDADYAPLASDDDDDDDEEIQVPTKRKRTRVMQIASDSDDSDRENESDNSQMEAKTPKSKSKLARKSSVDSPLTKKKAKRVTSDDDKVSFEDKLAASIASGSTNKKVNLKVEEKEHELDVVGTVWMHQKLEFLRPENIRDTKKRQPSHPEYDPKTLYVPDKYLNTLTPVG